MIPERREKRRRHDSGRAGEEGRRDAYKMEIPVEQLEELAARTGNIRRSSDRDGCRNRKYLICEEY